MPVNEKLSQYLTGKWQIGLWEAPVQAPIHFAYGCLCGCCMAATQRLDILEVIGEPYVCCGGMFPCGPLADECDLSWVWLEACCFPCCAITGNRFLIQTRFNRQNTKCDEMLLWCACCFRYSLCCFQCCCADLPEDMECFSDVLQMVVEGCMLAQQAVELKFVTKNGFHKPSPEMIAMMPPGQQRMINAGKPQLTPFAAMGVAIAAVGGGAAGGAAMQAITRPAVMGAPSITNQVAPPAGGMMPPGQQGMMMPNLAPEMSMGFMSMIAPNQMPWGMYCANKPVEVDPNSGALTGHWGECLAWAKVHEIQNAGWEKDPMFQGSSPCKQVKDAMMATNPDVMRSSVEQACNILEMTCQKAAVGTAKAEFARVKACSTE